MSEPWDGWDDDDDEPAAEPRSDRWVPGRGYVTGPKKRRRARNPLRRVTRLGKDKLRSARSRLSIFARPAGQTGSERRRSLVGSLLGALEGPWGRLVLCAGLLQLAWWLAAPSLH